MKRRRGVAAIAAAAGLLLGLVLGMVLRAGLDPRDASVPSRSREAEPGAGSAAELAALRDALAAEREDRVSLAAEVGRLRRDVEQLAPRLAEQGSDPSAGALDAGGGARGTSEADAEIAASDEGFEESALLERGVPPDEVARLHRRFEETEMAILYLRDRAAREGWDRRRRMMRELEQIRAGLRDDVGDESYDLMLYAAGRDNRVLIADVLASSPAQAADLRSGDVILRYGDRAIFSISELQDATRSGEAGALVSIEVVRDAEKLRTYLPRGPLGVRLRPVRRMPDTRW
jgi:hypothetical protein